MTPADAPRSPPTATAPLVLRAVLARPGLWPVAVRTVLRLARRGWWRRWPPLPLPGDGYWAFRMETVYGGAERRSSLADGDDVVVTMSVQDVRAFLRWCRGSHERGG